MPYVKGRLLTPDEAIKAGYCPECGFDFRTGSASGHRITHWRAEPPKGAVGDEARRRMKLYDEYLAAQAAAAAKPAPERQPAPLRQPQGSQGGAD